LVTPPLVVFSCAPGRALFTRGMFSFPNLGSVVAPLANLHKKGHFWGVPVVFSRTAQLRKNFFFGGIFYVSKFFWLTHSCRLLLWGGSPHRGFFFFGTLYGASETAFRTPLRKGAEGGPLPTKTPSFGRVVLFRPFVFGSVRDWEKLIILFWGRTVFSWQLTGKKTGGPEIFVSLSHITVLTPKNETTQQNKKKHPPQKQRTHAKRGFPNPRVFSRWGVFFSFVSPKPIHNNSPGVGAFPTTPLKKLSFLPPISQHFFFSDSLAPSFGCHPGCFSAVFFRAFNRGCFGRRRVRTQNLAIAVLVSKPSWFVQFCFFKN